MSVCEQINEKAQKTKLSWSWFALSFISQRKMNERESCFTLELELWSVLSGIYVVLTWPHCCFPPVGKVHQANHSPLSEAVFLAWRGLTLTNLIYPFKWGFAPHSQQILRHNCVIVWIFPQDNSVSFGRNQNKHTHAKVQKKRSGRSRQDYECLIFWLFIRLLRSNSF